MDKIIGVSEDELLVKILSYLPTKDVVITGVLSKQWKYLWKRVLKLEYDDTEVKNKPSISHKRFAVSRGVRQLSIAYSSDKKWYTATLPIHLYTCKSLVSLKVEGQISVFCHPSLKSLPSLKTLQLQSVSIRQYPLEWVLSNCPVLENLTLKIKHRDSTEELSINVPSLQSLSVEIDGETDFKGYVIDTPSLRYLKITDPYYRTSCSIENMPKLEEAYMDVVSHNTKKLLEPIASVKRLLLCLTVNSAQDVYSGGIVFNQLEHLKLCTCNTYWSNLLIQLLEDSPKLRVLELYVNEHSPISRTPMVNWKNHLSCVPQCIVTNLETFKWIGCEGRQEEIDVVAYILNNARCLKTATVLADESKINPQRKTEMINELVSYSLASATCKLTLNESFGE